MATDKFTPIARVPLVSPLDCDPDADTPPMGTVLAGLGADTQLGNPGEQSPVARKLRPMDLSLVGPVHDAAVDLFTAFPWVVFTSGRRSLEQQAHAMAENLALKRSWLVGSGRMDGTPGNERPVYVPSAARQACQAWLDCNPDKTSCAQISAGLLYVLRQCTNEQLGRLSKHLSGEAFDVQPVPDPRGAGPKAWLSARAAKVGAKFLTREGGLVRWHFEV